MHNQNDNIPADAEKRKFTGIWIPAEIWNDTELPAIAKLIYSEIASFGSAGCWKKTEELREPLGIGSELFQKLCRQLKDGGYIEEKRMFGRMVRKTTLGFRSSSGIVHQSVKPLVHQAEWQADEQAESPAVQLEYSKNKERIKGDKSPAKASKDSEKEQDEYGDSTINDFAKKWASATGNDCSKIKRERRAIHNLIKSQSKEGIDAILAAVQQIHESGDRYAPAITTPSELVGQYSKLPKLRLYVARNESAKTKSQKAIEKRYGTTLPDYSVSDAEREKVNQAIKAMKQSGNLPWVRQKEVESENQ